MLRISTMTQFIALIAFSIMLNVWNLKVLTLLMIAFLMLLSFQNNQHFFKLLKRLKWFFLVMLLIFLFNTPGEHIVNWPYEIKPTYEGVQAGLKQLLRIMLILAAISLILAWNSMQQLVSGIYCFLKPLNSIGVDVKRFAVRLWLTLHYVEQQQSAKVTATSLTKGLSARLNEAFADTSAQQEDIILENAKLAWFDYIVMIILIATLVASFMLKGQ